MFLVYMPRTKLGRPHAQKLAASLCFLAAAGDVRMYVHYTQLNICTWKHRRQPCLGRTEDQRV